MLEIAAYIEDDPRTPDDARGKRVLTLADMLTCPRDSTRAGSTPDRKDTEIPYLHHVQRETGLDIIGDLRG